jgi:hypothetical protein
LRAEENPFSSFFHLFQRGKTTLSPKPRALRRRLKKIAYPVWISLVISARRLKTLGDFVGILRKKASPKGSGRRNAFQRIF